MNIHIKKVQSVGRTWDDVSLLYPNKFHNSSEIMEEIANIETVVPMLVDVSVIGQSFLEKDIQLIRITNEANQDPKAGVFFVAQHHAREKITVEIALRFIQHLLNNYGVDETLTNYIDTEEIYIIPTLNPDGNDVVVDEGNEWLRKNTRPFDDDGDGEFDEDPIEDVDGDGKIYAFEVYEKPTPTWDLIESGFNAYPIETVIEGIDNDGDGLVNEDVIGFVDLNRNYDCYWNDSSFTSGWGSDPTVEDYPGTTPFSEPETVVLRDFALQHKFAAAMSLHSGINETYFPVYSNNYYTEPSLYYQLYLNLRAILPNRFIHSGINKDIATSTAGDWSLWMYEEAGCKVPMTFEIYNNASSLENDICYFLISDNETHQIWKWTGMYEYFSPTESATNFENLWFDIFPAFDYWLEITPRLQITIKSVKFTGFDVGDVVTLEVDIENLSPSLNTIEMIDFLNGDYEVLRRNGIPVKTIAIFPESSQSKTIEFELDQSITETSFILMVGNDYTGYQHIVLESGETTQYTTLSLSTSTRISQTSSRISGNTPGFILSSILIILPLFTILRGRRKN